MTITTPEGHQFVLYENEVVTIDLFSSLFITDGEFKGSYSYAGKAPLLPNMKAINHANLLEKHTSGVLENLQVRLGEFYWTNVNMQYHVVDQKEIEFALVLNLSIINERIKSTFLTQVPFPTYHLGDSVAEIENSMMQASLNTDWQIIPYTFAPVKNPEFSGITVEDSESYSEMEYYINSMRIVSGGLVFNAPNTLTTEGALKYFAVPYFYLNAVLSGIAEWLGFQKGGSVFIDPAISSIVIYNINAAWISTVNPPIESVNPMGMYITAADHLPKITVAEFFKTLTGMGVYPVLRANTNELLFKLKNNIRNFKTRNWSDKVERLGDITPEPYGGFKISFDPRKKQYGEEEIIDVVTTGNAENPHEFNLSTLEITHIQGSDIEMRIPFDSQVGNITDPNYKDIVEVTSIEDKRNFPLQLLYYNGWLQESPLKLVYPQLSSKHAVTGNELYLSSANGVYNTYLKDFFLAAEGAKKIKAHFILSKKDIADWVDDQIVIVNSKSGVSLPCLLKSLSFDTNSTSAIIRAVGEGIVLDSAVYKPAPTDRPYLLAIYENIHEYLELGAYPTKEGDLTLQLFMNRECTIPYDGPDILINITVKERYFYSGFYPTADFNERGFRVKLGDSAFTYSMMISQVTMNLIYMSALVEIQESPLFYILNNAES